VPDIWFAVGNPDPSLPSLGASPANPRINTSAGSIAASIHRIVAILANADQFRMLRPFGAQVEAVAGGMWCVNAQARF
jgi:hypothetical protein